MYIPEFVCGILATIGAEMNSGMATTMKKQQRNGTGERLDVYPRICMRNLGNHRRGNPVADWMRNFLQEVN